MKNSLLQPESNQCQYCCGKALESGNFGKANEELNEGISLLTNRQKMIKLADKSEFRFPSVQEYVWDDLADDEADAAKMKKAEKRTAAESKFLQDKKRRSSLKFSTSAPSTIIPGLGVHRAFFFCCWLSVYVPQGRYSGNFLRGSDLCLRCGKRAHWANSCPFKD